MGWLVCAMRWQLLELGAVLTREAGVRVADGRPLCGAAAHAAVAWLERSTSSSWAMFIDTPSNWPSVYALAATVYLFFSETLGRTPFRTRVTPQKSIVPHLQVGLPHKNQSHKMVTPHRTWRTPHSDHLPHPGISFTPCHEGRGHVPHIGQTLVGFTLI